MERYLPEPGMRHTQLPGMGGVYNQVNLAAYHYAGNNPAKYIDPSGFDVGLPSKDGPVRQIDVSALVRMPPDPWKLLVQLGRFGDPYILEGQTLTMEGSTPRYIYREFRKIEMIMLPVVEFQMAKEDPYFGGVIPVGAALGTGAAFQGTLQLTTHRLRGSERISSYTMQMMRLSGKSTIGTGWEQYTLQDVENRDFAQALLLHNPDLMERAITGSKPTTVDRIKEFIFEMFNF
jgi:hypothetical protein